MTRIFYTEQGSGPTAVLLHGFPFNHHLWNGFASDLAKDAHVVTPDLPGFGQSPLEPLAFSIDDIGVMVADWLREKNWGPLTLVGHSMGGYVALSVAVHYPELINGLVLFHSTAAADSDEKKASRDKAIAFVSEHGVGRFTSSFVAPLFANEAHPDLAAVRSISNEAREGAVRGYLLAMRDRKDRRDFLKTFSKPILFLAGAQDRGIDPESVRQQASLPSASTLHILPDVAHMGMFEARTQTIEILKEFIKER